MLLRVDTFRASADRGTNSAGRSLRLSGLERRPACVFGLPLSYDFVRSKRARLVPAFQALMLTVTFLPAVLIFTGYFRILGWVWSLPIIVALAVLCAGALLHSKHEFSPKHLTRPLICRPTLL
jgi:hypothetical protein